MVPQKSSNGACAQRMKTILSHLNKFIGKNTLFPSPAVSNHFLSPRSLLPCTNLFMSIGEYKIQQTIHVNFFGATIHHQKLMNLPTAVPPCYLRIQAKLMSNMSDSYTNSVQCLAYTSTCALLYNWAQSQ